MTVVQALSNAAWIASKTWSRPISWIGTGYALAIETPGIVNDRVKVVPGQFGGYLWHPTVRDLCSEWELVTPDAVLEERNRQDD